MNQKIMVRTIVGIAIGTTIAMLLKKAFADKTNVDKRSRQLSNAIDKKLRQDQEDLKHVQQVLTAQLEKVNSEIERLTDETA